MATMKAPVGFQNRRVVIIADSGKGKSWLTWDLPFELGELEAVVLVAPESTQENEVTSTAKKMLDQAGIPLVQITPKPNQTRLELPAFKRPSMLIFDDVGGTPMAESAQGEVIQQFIRGRHQLRHVFFLVQSRHRLPRPVFDNATDIIIRSENLDEGLARRLGHCDPTRFLESAARIGKGASPWRIIQPPFKKVSEFALPDLPKDPKKLIALLRRRAKVPTPSPPYPLLETALGVRAAGNLRATSSMQPWLFHRDSASSFR